MFIPRQTSATTVYWIIEGQSITPSHFGTGGVNLTPHTVGDRVQLSRSFMMQSSPDAEAITREDIIAQIVELESDVETGNALLGNLHS